MSDTHPEINMDLEAAAIHEAARETEHGLAGTSYSPAEWDERFRENLEAARKRVGLPT